MRIVVTNDCGITCDAELNDGERRVTSLRLDDEHAARALVGLSALSGCVAAVLEDAASASGSGVTANEIQLNSIQNLLAVEGSDVVFWMRDAGSGAPRLRAVRPEAPTCEGGCE